MTSPLILDDYLAIPGNTLKGAFLDVVMATKGYNGTVIVGQAQTLSSGNLHIQSGTTVQGSFDLKVESEAYSKNDVPVNILDNVVFNHGLTVRVTGLNGSAPPTNDFVIQIGSNVTMQSLYLYSTHQRPASGIWTNGNNVNIGYLHVENIESPVSIVDADSINGSGHTDSSGSNIGFFYCRNYRRAIYYNNHSSATLNGYDIANSDSGLQAQYGNDSGNNALLIQNVTNSVFGCGTGGDCGEHFMRFGGSGASGIIVGDIDAHNTGLSVVKINVGVAYQRATDIQFGIIKGTDVGVLSVGRDEETLIRFSHCDNITVEEAIGIKTSSSSSCNYGVMGNDWDNVTIKSLNCPDFLNAIRFDSTYDVGEGYPAGDYNSYGPIRDSYIKLVSGSASSAPLVQVSEPTPTLSSPPAITDNRNGGVSGLTVELAVPSLQSGQSLLNLGTSQLTGTVQVPPPPNSTPTQPTTTAALGGGIAIIGSVGGTVAPTASFGITPDQWAYTRFDLETPVANPPSQRWREASPTPLSYEQLCAVEQALDRWARAGYVGGSSPKLTAFSVLATAGLQRQLMNILGDPATPTQLFSWITTSGTGTTADYRGILSLNNPMAILSSLFPSAGFVGVYVMDSESSDTDFDFGTSSHVSNVFRFNSRNAAGVPTFRIGSTTDLTVSGTVGDSTGFWGMSWNSSKWQITRNGVAVGSQGTFGSAPVMPMTPIALGNNGGVYSTRHHGLVMWGPVMLAVADVATIYTDVQRIMDAAAAV